MVCLALLPALLLVRFCRSRGTDQHCNGRGCVELAEHADLTETRRQGCMADSSCRRRAAAANRRTWDGYFRSCSAPNSRTVARRAPTPDQQQSPDQTLDLTHELE